MLARSVLTATCVLVLCAAVTPDEPRVVRENIEWLDVWVPDTAARDRPRVLLVGDSITRGYYKDVEDRLKGTAYVARLTTSKSLGDPGFLAEVALVLGQTPFDVVHFNNGLHGWGYTEPEYRAAVPQLLATLRKGTNGAKLLWASTTPVREAGQLDRLSPKTDRVRERNRIAGEVVGTAKIPVNDLFGLVESHPEYYSRDGVHFNARGNAVLAEQVARSIAAVLK